MEIKTGLWKKKSQNGNIYCSGKFNLNGEDYFITLFNNDKKGNEKAPDFQIFIRDGVINQGNDKNGNMTPQNSEIKGNSEIVRDVFVEFGEETKEITNDDLAF